MPSFLKMVTQKAFFRRLLFCEIAALISEALILVVAAPKPDF